MNPTFDVPVAQGDQLWHTLCSITSSDLFSDASSLVFWFAFLMGET